MNFTRTFHLLLVEVPFVFFADFSFSSETIENDFKIYIEAESTVNSKMIVEAMPIVIKFFFTYSTLNFGPPPILNQLDYDVSVVYDQNSKEPEIFFQDTIVINGLKLTNYLSDDPFNTNFYQGEMNIDRGICVPTNSLYLIIRARVIFNGGSCVSENKVVSAGMLPSMSNTYNRMREGYIRRHILDNGLGLCYLWLKEYEPKNDRKELLYHSRVFKASDDKTRIYVPWLRNCVGTGCGTGICPESQSVYGGGENPLTDVGLAMAFFSKEFLTYENSDSLYQACKLFEYVKQSEYRFPNNEPSGFFLRCRWPGDISMATNKEYFYASMDEIAGMVLGLLHLKHALTRWQVIYDGPEEKFFWTVENEVVDLSHRLGVHLTSYWYLLVPPESAPKSDLPRDNQSLPRGWISGPLYEWFLHIGLETITWNKYQWHYEPVWSIERALLEQAKGCDGWAGRMCYILGLASAGETVGILGIAASGGNPFGRALLNIHGTYLAMAVPDKIGFLWWDIDPTNFNRYNFPMLLHMYQIGMEYPHKYKDEYEPEVEELKIEMTKLITAVLSGNFEPNVTGFVDLFNLLLNPAALLDLSPRVTHDPEDDLYAAAVAWRYLLDVPKDLMKRAIDGALNKFWTDLPVGTRTENLKTPPIINDHNPDDLWGHRFCWERTPGNRTNEHSVDESKYENDKEIYLPDNGLWNSQISEMHEKGIDVMIEAPGMDYLYPRILLEQIHKIFIPWPDPGQWVDYYWREYFFGETTDSRMESHHIFFGPHPNIYLPVCYTIPEALVRTSTEIPCEEYLDNGKRCFVKLPNEKDDDLELDTDGQRRNDIMYKPISLDTDPEPPALLKTDVILSNLPELEFNKQYDNLNLDSKKTWRPCTMGRSPSGRLPGCGPWDGGKIIYYDPTVYWNPDQFPKIPRNTFIQTIIDTDFFLLNPIKSCRYKIVAGYFVDNDGQMVWAQVPILVDGEPYNEGEFIDGSQGHIIMAWPGYEYPISRWNKYPIIIIDDEVFKDSVTITGDNYIEKGNPVDFIANLTGVDPGKTPQYTWSIVSGPGALSGTHSAHSTITSLQEGETILKIVAGDGICTDAENTHTIIWTKNRYSLGFADNPRDVIEGAAGKSKTIEMYVTLNSASFGGEMEGAQGWQFSLGITGGVIKSVQVAGLTLTTMFDSDGNLNTPPENPFQMDLQNASIAFAQPSVFKNNSKRLGAVSAVVLSHDGRITLQPNDFERIAKLILVVMMPPENQEKVVSLNFVDGFLQGSGNPVINTVTLRGKTLFPVLGECKFTLRGCSEKPDNVTITGPTGAETKTTIQLNAFLDGIDPGLTAKYAWSIEGKGSIVGRDDQMDVKITSSEEGHSLVILDAGDGICEEAIAYHPISWNEPNSKKSFTFGFSGYPTSTVNGITGEVKAIQIDATLTSNVESGTEGAAGWQISLAALGGTIQSIGLGGLVVSTIFDDDGKPETPPQDPHLLNLLNAYYAVSQVATHMDDSSRKGGISGVMLSDGKFPIFLHKQGTEKIARVTISVTVPAVGEEKEVTLKYEDWFKGLGLPIANEVTLRGASSIPDLGKCRFNVRGTAAGPIQKPMDVNQDGVLDISDSIMVLNLLFRSVVDTLPCGNGTIFDPANVRLLDFNGDGVINITDPISVLGFLFLGDSLPALGSYCISIPGCPNNAGKCEGS
jgi:hypothetical protein